MLVPRVIMYLPTRHNEIVKSIYHQILEVIEPGQKDGEPPPVTKNWSYEIWWDRVVMKQATNWNTIEQILVSGTTKHIHAVSLKLQCPLNVTARTKRKYAWNLLKPSEYCTQHASRRSSPLLWERWEQITEEKFNWALSWPQRTENR